MTADALKIVVLISGNGSNLQAIIDAIESKQINVVIKAVISNKKNAYGLTRAKNVSIATEVIEHKDYSQRIDFDKKLIEVIDSYQADLIVLAGFMRILTDDFVQNYPNKIINIHPSLLPKYKGLHTHKRALEAGDQEHGLTIHFVCPELDSGPIIKQVKIPILAGDNEETLAARLLIEEHKAYPEVLQQLYMQMK